MNTKAEDIAYQKQLQGYRDRLKELQLAEAEAEKVDTSKLDAEQHIEHIFGYSERLLEVAKLCIQLGRFKTSNDAVMNLLDRLQGVVSANAHADGQSAKLFSGKKPLIILGKGGDA